MEAVFFLGACSALNEVSKFLFRSRNFTSDVRVVGMEDDTSVVPVCEDPPFVTKTDTCSTSQRTVRFSEISTKVPKIIPLSPASTNRTVSTADDDETAHVTDDEDDGALFDQSISASPKVYSTLSIQGDTIEVELSFDNHSANSPPFLQGEHSFRPIVDNLERIDRKVRTPRRLSHKNRIRKVRKLLVEGYEQTSSKPIRSCHFERRSPYRVKD